MRIRTIKPEFFDSPHTAKASAVARIAYIGLWCWADDTGRGTFNPKELEGAIFPNDDVTELSHGEFADFRGVLRQVAAAFGVLVYEVDGRTFFQIPSWDRHQRVRDGHESRLPGPDATNARVLNEFSGSHDDLPHSAADCGSLPPGTGEQGNRGTGEQGNSTPPNGGVERARDEPQPRRKRKAPETPIPDDWTPTDAHRKRAADLGVDIDHEAQQFRAHAEAHDRRCARWNAAFTQWLGNAHPRPHTYRNQAQIMADARAQANAATWAQGNALNLIEGGAA